MKHIVRITVVLALAAALFVSCSSKGTGYEDGIYFAQQTEFPKSGWKYNVTLKVEDGEFTEVVWNRLQYQCRTRQGFRFQSR